ncbi:hypothetical protein [Bartonella sp. DGB2]|uniref:hypothetical protein n=1 Tax=Bartonella sp. DGB2 TaxID=3388426 RepID=UPI00399007C2
MNIIPPITDTPFKDSVDITIVGSALSSPFWLPWLMTVSQTTALLFPLFSIIWIIVRTWAIIKDEKRKDNEHRSNDD